MLSANRLEKKIPSYERQLEPLHFIVIKKRNLSDRRVRTGKKFHPYKTLNPFLQALFPICLP